MLDRFPGRTLEELDQMDMGRYFRALEAKGMLPVERRRRSWLDGHLETKDLSSDEWAEIREHDRLVGDG